MKKIFIFIILIISQFFMGNNIFAYGIPVEKVFKDIDKNYKYYNELQTLYERGMIFPDENGGFNPKKLLNRDEFVGISMEVACKKCIAPNTNFSLIKKYSNTKTFYDVSENNKYFYCIAESDELNYVKGYDKGYKCENSKNYKKEKRPFCIDNKITLDEALAVILRNSGIFTIEDNKKVIKDIYDGKITKKLSDDVSPKNNNGQVYTFYGYLQKALNFQLKEVDKDGNEKIYYLLQKHNNKIYPYKKINKEEFLIMAYIALKSNSCLKDENDNLALQIEILNKECIKGQKCLNKKIKENEDTFDFNAKIKSTCKKGINKKNYKWIFYNFSTKQEIKKEGKYIDNYKFLSTGKWRIILKVIDNCGNKGEIFNTIFIGNNNNLGVELDANPLYGPKDLLVNYTGKAKGGDGNYSYSWDFGDGNSGYGKNPKHNYSKAGTYIVKLTVTDSSGKSGTASATIVVTDDDINNNNLGVELDANPLYGPKDLLVNYTGKAKGGDGNYSYSWDFGDGNSGYGKNPKHNYTKAGTYIVKLTVTDSNGKSGTASATIVVTDDDIKKALNVSINADPILGNYDLNVHFDGLVNGGNGNYTYKWDFGDLKKGNGKNPNNTYIYPGIYKVILEVIDTNGNKGQASILIKVLDFDSCEIDADGDGIVDCADKCPKVKGDIKNNGCPIFEEKCGIGCSCEKGYECTNKNPETCQTDGICTPIKSSLNQCLEEGFNSYIYGNIVCETCPCQYKLDFYAIIRKCDLIFPAITSIDSKNIFSKGPNYKINVQKNG